jgi:hypothetical protein
MSQAIAGLLCGTVLLMSADIQLPNPFDLRRFDTRSDFPPPKPFKDDDTLPGNTPNAKVLKDTWYYRHIQRDVTMETGKEPQLFASIHLNFLGEGLYELRYLAYWGPTRSVSDPRFSGVKVEEKGRYTRSGDIIIFEPRVTQHTQQIKGQPRTHETIRNQKHTYVARVDGSYLNLAGRCASYQVEPICKETRNVWFSLRLTGRDSIPEMPDF